MNRCGILSERASSLVNSRQRGCLRIISFQHATVGWSGFFTNAQLCARCLSRLERSGGSMNVGERSVLSVKRSSMHLSARYVMRPCFS